MTSTPISLDLLFPLPYRKRDDRRNRIAPFVGARGIVHPTRSPFASSIGRKILMSLTGLALIGFLVTHLAGNLLLFAGPQTFNHYSHTLVSNPLIYGAELFLLAIFLSHLLAGILLTFRNREARPIPYVAQGNAGRPSRRSAFSFNMILSGLVVLAFVPLHIWEFKYGPHYESAEPGVRDLHRLVVETFRNPYLTIWYMVAMAVIGTHLWHGFGSSFESLGVRYRKPVAWGCRLLAAVIAGGFLVIPALVYYTGGKL